MYELNRTLARRAFKEMLGQANHFLITILVGLNGVRSGRAGIEKEFHTSWNPQSVPRSADRSREFVLDLALVRAIDAFDTYMMTTVRKPCALSESDFLTKMNATGQSVARRLEVFDERLAPLPRYQKAALSVAIDWRNRRVHSLSTPSLDKRTARLLLGNSKTFSSEYSGLKIEEFVSHFKAGSPPTFKEAASIIRMVHEAVEHYDQYLLRHVPIESYLKTALLQFLSAGVSSPANGIHKTWNSPKKERKVKRLLRMVGVNETEQATGRKVPDDFVQQLTTLQSNEVLEFLQV
ncbi:MAG: hypothetical protein AB3N19_09415 [Ruegeria sp.]